jgi:murein endopeptidase
MGGNRQQERMIKGKRRSLDRAVWNSYQAAEVIKIDAEDRKPVRALINPNKLKQDYDDKIISIGYEYNF